jgi:hypothetical protein
MYYDWNMGDNTSPYVVWGAQLHDSMNSNCQGFICEGKDFRKYDDTIWKFLGKGDYGVMDFSFDINRNKQIDPEELFDTFVIRFGQDIGFDSITGLTQDRKMLAYGFLMNGENAIPYGESSNLSLATLTDTKNKNLPQPICGIVDPSILGDESFSIASGSGSLIFGFSAKGFNDGSPAISQSYSLISLTISSAPKHLISPENVCP